MAVVESEIQLQQSAAHPTNDTDAAGGDISSPRVTITNSAPGEFITKMSANPSGGALKNQCQTGYLENTNGTDTYYRAGVYGKNVLVVPASAGQIKLQSSSASDGSSKTARVWFLDNLGALQSPEDITLNGTTEVPSVATNVSRVLRVDIIDSTTGALVAAAGDITVKVGAETIGKVPATHNWATSEYRCVFAASSGDVASPGNRTQLPAGVSWKRPNTPETRAYVRDDSANSNLGPNVYCALYVHQELYAGMPSISDRNIDWQKHGEDVA